jgi:hypothetical protein
LVGNLCINRELSGIGVDSRFRDTTFDYTSRPRIYVVRTLDHTTYFIFYNCFCFKIFLRPNTLYNPFKFFFWLNNPFNTFRKDINVPNILIFNQQNIISKKSLRVCLLFICNYFILILDQFTPKMIWEKDCTTRCINNC